MTRDPDVDPVELGVQLLDHLDDTEVSVADIIDRIETITTHPATTRAILDTAQARGIIERDGTTVKPTGQVGPQFQSDITTKDGTFTCQRCGKSLSTGYFIRLEAGELGPFGPTCIYKVTGQEV